LKKWAFANNCLTQQAGNSSPRNVVFARTPRQMPTLDLTGSTQINGLIATNALAGVTAAARPPYVGDNNAHWNKAIPTAVRITGAGPLDQKIGTGS